MTLARAWYSADGGGLTVTLLQDPAGLQLDGEADLLTAGALREAVKALPADAREIRLELAGLRFIDVASARELVLLAGRPAMPRLTFQQPSRTLLLLLGLLWPDCEQAPALAGPMTGGGATSAEGRLTVTAAPRQPSA